jgi:hypothetical protein
MYHCNPIGNKIQTFTQGFHDCLVPDVFQNVMSKPFLEIE